MSSPSVVDELSDKKPFNLVTAHMVFNHLSDQGYKDALSNIFQLLEDGGFYISLVPYPGLPHRIDTLIDSEDGYWSEEEAPWGGTIAYRHRPFSAYQETSELSGFITKTTSAMVDNLPSRLISVGQKNEAFKHHQEEIGLDSSLVTKRK